MIVLRTDSFISPEHRARILREVKEYGVAILDGGDWSVTEVESDLLNVLRRRVRSLKKQRDNATQERDFTSKWFAEAVEELEKERKSNRALCEKNADLISSLEVVKSQRDEFKNELTKVAKELNREESKNDILAKDLGEANDEIVRLYTSLTGARVECKALQNKLANTATGCLTSKDLDLALKFKYGNVAAHNLSFSYDTDYGTGVEMSFRFKEGSHDRENYLWKSLKERML